jgi:hypothetical protein
MRLKEANLTYKIICKVKSVQSAALGSFLL